MPRTRAWLNCLVIALCLMLVAPLATAELPVQLLSLKHRLPDEVLPALRPLLATGESIAGHDTRLIVRASPATVKQIEQILAQIDTQRRNVRISVRSDETREARAQEQGISGDVGRGNTRIVVANGTRPDGAGVNVRGPSGSVQLHTERRVTTRQDSLAHTLIVMDGGHGFLRVGESIPTVQTYLAFVGHRPELVTGIQYYDVTTGFEVEPRVVGERVQLALSPRLAFRSSQGVQNVEMREMRTTVTVVPGEWTDIGGMMESANDLNRAILSGQQRTRANSTSFQVRVDLQP